MTDVRVDLPEGSFVMRIVGSRVTATMTPLMFVSALLQCDSGGSVLGSNVRFRWIVVYNEQRDTLARGVPVLANRAVVVKVNRLVRF